MNGNYFRWREPVKILLRVLSHENYASNTSRTRSISVCCWEALDTNRSKFQKIDIPSQVAAA